VSHDNSFSSGKLDAQPLQGLRSGHTGLFKASLVLGIVVMRLLLVPGALDAGVLSPGACKSSVDVVRWEGLRSSGIRSCAPCRPEGLEGMVVVGLRCPRSFCEGKGFMHARLWVALALERTLHGKGASIAAVKVR
jgi:hypothetical protein